VRDPIIPLSLPRNEGTQRPPTDSRCVVRIERHNPPLIPQLSRRERCDRAPKRVSMTMMLYSGYETANFASRGTTRSRAAASGA
jgi:hypothetical protein